MNATKNRIAIQEYKHNGQFVAGTNTDEHLYAFDRQALEQAVRAVNSYDAMREALEKSKRRIIQLSDTANYLSNRLGLGNKVHADDFYDVIDNALALANGSRER